MPSSLSPRPCRRAYDIFNPQYLRGDGHGGGESQSQSFLMNTTYTFLAETDHNGVKTVNAASTTSESLADVVQSFEYFLKGACGSCSSSTETLKYAIEAKLRERVLPTLVVEQVTPV